MHTAAAVRPPGAPVRDAADELADPARMPTPAQTRALAKSATKAAAAFPARAAWRVERNRGRTPGSSRAGPAPRPRMRSQRKPPAPRQQGTGGYSIVQAFGRSYPA
ncbi:hypothetical protein DMP07_01790 [Slackia faecicanis]|uniref:Uncharacterized protein n=1 Tax=Slackia faecicanis TaxID=255723 RepID=A0A3N0AHS9_9ACTN|nr:hypothetical protein DMP07_01790 [Slackia faecicanis]